MRQLTLLRLELSQFQKFDRLSINFRDTDNEIIGDNGTGKTTIYSALSWLLFGKDAYGREKFDIKHLVNGKRQERVDVEVNGKFVITDDGALVSEFELRRVLAESWNEKTNTYKGDETKCYINNVPTLVSDYSKYISEIVREEDFRMITSVNYFLSLPMEKQRERLCQMAGIRSAEEIAATNHEWQKVLSLKPRNTDIDGWMKIQKESLKRLKEQKSGIQPAINALVHSKPDERNWDELISRQAEIKSKIDANAEMLSSSDSADRILNERKSKLRSAIIQLNTDIASLDAEAQSLIISEKNKIAESVCLKNREYDDYRSKTESVKSDIDSVRNRIDAKKAELERLELVLEQKTNEYADEEAKKFTKDAEYPLCPLLDSVECYNSEVVEKFKEKQEEMRRKFMDKKSEMLSAILKEGRTALRQRDKAKEDLNTLVNELSELKGKYEAMSDKLSGMTRSDASSVYVDVKSITAPFIIKKRQFEDKIKELREELDSIPESQEAASDSLKAEREKLINEYKSVVSQLSDKSQIERIDTQIDCKRKEGIEISDKINTCENNINVLTEIRRAAVDDAANRINSMFQVTKWQTTVQQKNGDYKDVCLPTIDGVSASLNTASRINVGLDICMAVSNHLGIRVPLFIDNAESINKFIRLDTQVIRLRVAKEGTPLTIQ